MKIDKFISVSGNSKFSFNKEVTDVFDSHVKKSVPMYTEFHNLIANISDWFVEEGAFVFDLGVSTGECIKNIFDRHGDERMEYIGLDKSIDMVNKAYENLKDKNIKLFKEDISDESFSIRNACVVTSVLTLQFIPIVKRGPLIKTIYEGLNPGGALIVVEKVNGVGPTAHEIFKEIHHDKKIENGFTAEEVINKSKAIRGTMRPITTAENMKMMLDAGFKEVDIFFKWCNFVGFIAVK